MDQSGSDFLQLRAGDVPPRAIADWLSGRVRDAVVDGRLRSGDRLPATRALSGDLGVSRGVVVEAYERLYEQGLVTSRTRAGTVVADRPVPTSAGRSVVVSTPMGRPGGPRDPSRVDLSPGVPDLSAFPRTAWLRHERAVLQHAVAADLGYGDPRGHPDLRTELAAWLSRTRGVVAEPDGVLVVAGVAQALALLAQTMTARGETRVAVEEPGSRGARLELEHWGLTCLPTPVDDEGVMVADLPSTAQAAVLTPAHQFPTGVVLSPSRRRALLTWAQQGRLVIEDDYDAEHRYDRAPVAALQGTAPDLVAHTGSTSKSLAPGMRLGWLVPPVDRYAELVEARYASDLGSPALPQLVLARMLGSGDYDRHLRRVRERQRRRRDALVDALGRWIPRARVSGVAAGLHLLVTWPELTGALDDAALAERMAHAGITVQPLSWHRLEPGPPGLVLGYAAETPDRLRAAVRLLAETVTT